MTTLGAVLVVVGSAVFTVALVAGLYAAFGPWAALAAVSLIAVGAGRFLIGIGGESE